MQMAEAMEKGGEAWLVSGVAETMESSSPRPEPSSDPLRV